MRASRLFGTGEGRRWLEIGIYTRWHPRTKKTRCCPGLRGLTVAESSGKVHGGAANVIFFFCLCSYWRGRPLLSRGPRQQSPRKASVCKSAPPRGSSSLPSCSLVAFFRDVLHTTSKGMSWFVTSFHPPSSQRQSVQACTAVPRLCKPSRYTILPFAVGFSRPRLLSTASSRVTSLLDHKTRNLLE